MWSKGVIGIPVTGEKQSICHYIVRHNKRSSKTRGLDGGRIMKLQIKINGECTAEYNEGTWATEPEDEATKLAIIICMKDYN